jgi:hypothetical protein
MILSGRTARQPGRATTKNPFTAKGAKAAKETSFLTTKEHEGKHQEHEGKQENRRSTSRI